jgi:dUTP pyrophosphatase
MIKSERVPVQDIAVGDIVMHRDRAVRVEQVVEVSSGYIFDTEDTKFMNRTGETVVRLRKDGLKVKITKCDDAIDLELPAYSTTHSAGMDLRAAISKGGLVKLYPGARHLVPTGIKVAVPEGYAAYVLPRSGLALKHGISLANAPGLIDADYRGEIGVILINHGNVAFEIERGMKIAQLVVAPVSCVQWKEVETLEETERSSGGFGHTGV